MAAMPASRPGAAPPRLQVAGWTGQGGPMHGFFGRRGGVSRGDLASLNVSDCVGDHPETVAENWAAVHRAAPGLRIARMQQVHGTRVVSVTSETHVGEADGMLSRAPGVGLAVLTADCVPILGCAPRHGAVMALHAGWRGSLAGIAAVALRLAADELGIPVAEWRLALGPSIGGCCYEVEAGIGDRFVERWGAMPNAWQPAGARGQLDLRQANRAILVAQGVPAEAIADVGPCTSCASDAFFSHRRSDGRAGRQLSLIGLPSEPS